MKLICDVPDDIYNEALNGRYKCKECFDVITNGTPIPDNATNGDIVQMIFPYYSYERNDYVQSTEDYIIDSMECMEHDLYFDMIGGTAHIRKAVSDAT